MKQFAFVYSRTKHQDYRLLADLSEGICPNSIRDMFVQRIRIFVKTDAGMDSPQWLFVKEQGIVLWGVVCMNEMLDSAYSFDKEPRPLRGFTGIVIPNYSAESLPFDLNVFKEVFRSVMVSIFDSFIQREHVDKLVDIGSASSFIHPKPFDTRLNTDYHYCRLFAPTIDAESLVASCLSYPADISIAINVARSDSVITTEFNPLFNAVMRLGVGKDYEDVMVMHQCKVCGKTSQDLMDGGFCQDCWDKQHPHCSRCGKETSDLRDGLCENCYNKEHPRCTRCNKEAAFLQDGLCPECWDKDNIYCTKCGRKMAFHTKNDVCEECARKKRVRMVLFSVVILLSIMILLAVKKCKQEPEFYRPKEPIPERIIPEIPKNTRHASEIMQSREVMYEQYHERPAETNEMIEEEMQEPRGKVGAEPNDIEYRKPN